MATLGLSEAERESIERFEQRGHPSLDDGAGHPRFLGGMVRPVQAASPDPRQGRGRLCRTKASSSPRSTSTRTSCSPRSSGSSRSRPSTRSTAGQPVADLTNYRTEGQLKKALDQLLAQLKIEPEGATPQAEIEPLVAMGEQVLAEGDAPRAVTIFRQVRDMAPDDPEVIGGLARALIAAGESDEAQPAARWPPGGACRASRRSRAPAPRSRWRPLRPRRTRARSKRGLPRTPTIMRRGSSWPRRRWRPAIATAAADALLEIITPRPRMERRRGAQALPPAARSAGPRRPLVERPAPATVGRARSHEPPDPAADLPAARRDPVPALAASAAHFRAALSRDGARRDRWRRPNRHDPAAPARRRQPGAALSASAASARSSASRSWTTGGSTSCCSDRTGSG